MAGKKKFKRGEEQSGRVYRLAMIGCNDNHIASIEKMSEATLKNLYASELHEGRAKGVGAVSQTAYQLALSGKNPAMTMFFLKCRARWKEVHTVEHSGVDGSPITTAEVTTAQLKRIAAQIADKDEEE